MASNALIDDLPYWNGRYFTSSSMLSEQGKQLPRDIHRRFEVQGQLLELVSNRGRHLYFDNVKRHLIEVKIVSTKPGSILGAGCKEF
jgi:hypothetical protein